VVTKVARFAPSGIARPGQNNPLPNAGQVNLVNGTIALQVQIPATGTLDPPFILSYNTLNKTWGGTYDRSIQFPTSLAASITTSEGDNYGNYTQNPITQAWTPPPGAQNSLSGNQPGPITETQPDGLKYHYPAAGAIDYIQTPATGRWTVSRRTNVTGIIGPVGPRTTIAYSATTGKMRRVQDSGGRITSLSFSSTLGDLTRITAPDLSITTIAYDGSTHRLRRWQNPGGDIASFTYDSSGRLLQQFSPQGERTTYGYGTNVTIRTDPRGKRTTYSFYAADSNFRSMTDATGAITSYSWDTGFLRSVTDGRGNRATFSYLTLSNNARMLQSAGTPLGNRFTFVWDTTNNRVRALIDELGGRSTLLWDGSGNRIALIDVLGNRTTYGYNSQGQLTVIRNALGIRETTLYDSSGRRLADLNPLGNRTTYGLNANSQVIRSQNPLGAITTLVRDSLNRVTAQVDCLGRRTTSSYDLNGHLISHKDPLGNTTSWRYSSDGELLAEINPLGNRVS
jgi:YD repeat-containing protein